MRSPGHHPIHGFECGRTEYAPMPHAAHTRSRQVDVYARTVRGRRGVGPGPPRPAARRARGAAPPAPRARARSLAR